MATLTPTFSDDFNALDLKSGPWRSGMDYAPQGSTADDLSSWVAGDLSRLPADANPVSVSGGMLSLAIKPTPGDVNPGSVGNRPFISGEITTKGQFAQTYGYFEATAKMASGAGAISAFWLLPADGSWPPELDVAEILGNTPKTDINTAHSKIGSAGAHWADIPDATQGFHTYAVDWQPDKITWYFDGKQTAQENTPADMNKPMYMLLDTQAGAAGSWIGEAKPGLNTAMQVDSVRVYASNPYTGGNSPAPAAQAAATSSSDPTVAAVNTLTLHLSEDSYQGNAKFQVAVDGKTLNPPTEVTALHSAGSVQDFAFNVAAGPHDVAVSFLNDAYGGTASTDRNLYVQSLDYNGQQQAGAILYGAGTQHFHIG